MTAGVKELLPWYVNGTLSAEERQRVDDALAMDPELRNELAFCEQLKGAVHGAAPEVPDTLSAAAVLARIRPRRSTALANRLRHWWTSPLLPRLAYAMAAVVVVQTAVLAWLVVERGESFSDVRSPTRAAPITGPFIRVSFKPEARESDIRFLLTGLAATIVGGPTQLGDYFLFVDGDRADWAAQQLRQSPIVDAVTIIARLPPAKD